MAKFYKNILNTLFMFACFCLFTDRPIYSHNDYDDDDDYEKILDGEKVIPYAILNYEPLRFFDLDNTYFANSFFCYADLYGASLIEANLEGCDFYEARLEAADLTEASFCGSILLSTNLENAKVLKANFKNVIGLTNSQKEYLRKNGAINVPKDLSKEEFEQEFKMIVEWKKQFEILEQLKNLFRKLFCCCRKKEII